MTFNSIIKNITSGLTGNPDNDMQYLMDQGEKYKSSKYSKEISRTIGRLIYDIIPEDKRNELSKIIDNHELGIEKIIEEADFQIFKKNFTKARILLEEIINEINSSGLYSDDNVSEYKCFSNLLEEIVYKEYFKPQKEVRKIPENFTLVFLRYGVILFELKEFEKSEEALKRSLKYNPVKTDALFELSEIYKHNKEWDEYLNINKTCLDYCYTSMSLGRCYRNLGFYYIEKEDYDLAVALFYLSLNFDQESKIAQSELLYISNKTNRQIKNPDIENVKKLLFENDIELGANKLILRLAIALGKQAQSENIPDAAKYFYSVFYDLTGDEEVKKIIASLDK
jgi:tetratricopeptide (TPR) repeat protein